MKGLSDRVGTDAGPVLIVPNWSLGRERTVVRQMRDLVEYSPVTVHYCQADVDHNRTVTALSGPPGCVLEALEGLCQLALPSVNLQRHAGVHPRIGALDVLPFVALPGGMPEAELLPLVDAAAEWLAETWGLPVFLYEKSARRPDADLPHLRKGGYGGMVGRELEPDFGPGHVHPHMGASVVGVRDFLVALNVNFRSDDVVQCERVAQEVRARRRRKEAMFAGVRALGFSLPSQGLVQVSLNFTRPDETEIDPVVDWVVERVGRASLAYVELIGVIRDRDLAAGTCVAARAEQVVPWASPGS